MASSALTAPAAAPEQRPAQLTNLARKYGHPYRKINGMSHRILKNTGKSGITPLSPFFTASPTQSPDRQKHKYRVYYYQQHRYQGFTAAELHEMESLSALDTSPISSGLTNAIHAMFLKSQWDTEATLSRHVPLLPLFTGKDGFWQVCLNPAPFDVSSETNQLGTDTVKGRQSDRVENP